MIALKRAVDILLVFVLFPIAALLIVSIVIAVNVVAFAVYVGALLAIWLLFAFVFPLSVGIMTPDEVFTRIRSLRREGRYFEGEPLPSDNSLWMRHEVVTRIRSLRREGSHGEPLPSDNALWMRWNRGDSELTP